jgi:hypothetical protein
MTQALDEPVLASARRHLPLLTRCPVPGCTTLTMGGTCVEHDAPVLTVFPRGRPFVEPARRDDVAVAAAD